ncbi:MAG: tRNA pseudouridine(38-40) synthase TruA [Lachnospiraceae bacterium]|nr:tRNA pseudouridine(38-40) synthase TruA [Lachnospiraceae bacterium]
MSKRVRLFVSYDGTGYHGWQIQNNVLTVEQVITEALQKLTGEEIEIYGASRTDAGVHALQNVAVFDTESSIPAEKFAFALNSGLPEDIRITSSDEVDSSWHPRYVNSVKTYVYTLYTGKIMNPIRRLYTYHFYNKIDLDKMREASACLVGEHDFKSFCQSDAQVNSTVRTVLSIDIWEEGEEVKFKIKGTGFLYNMVRIIVGTLLEVGVGRKNPAWVKEVLEKKDRTAAGPTAPAKGLTLYQYEFEN